MGQLVEASNYKQFIHSANISLVVMASGTGKTGKHVRALIGYKIQDNCPCRAEQATDDEVHLDGGWGLGAGGQGRRGRQTLGKYKNEHK